MTTFRLEKSSSSSSRTLAKFNVLRGDDLVGSISVKPSEENDLRAHWKDVSPSPSSARASGSSSKQVAAMVKASKKPTRAAVLRGC